MEVFDKDIQFLKDIWADLDKREVTKRTIVIALAAANPEIKLGDARLLSDVLDDMLLEPEASTNKADKNMTM